MKIPITGANHILNTYDFKSFFTDLSAKCDDCHSRRLRFEKISLNNVVPIALTIRNASYGIKLIIKIICLKVLKAPISLFLGVTTKSVTVKTRGIINTKKHNSAI